MRRKSAPMRARHPVSDKLVGGLLIVFLLAALLF